MTIEERFDGSGHVTQSIRAGEIEKRWYAFWNRRSCSARREQDRQRVSHRHPTPNVTGSLHMGHALNNTLQDILIRYHRMNGYKTLWMPAWITLV